MFLLLLLLLFSIYGYKFNCFTVFFIISTLLYCQLFLSIYVHTGKKVRFHTHF